MEYLASLLERLPALRHVHLRHGKEPAWRLADRARGWDLEAMAEGHSPAAEAAEQSILDNRGGGDGSMVAAGGGDGGAHARVIDQMDARLEAKLERLLAAQTATQSQVADLGTKLNRLDAMAEWIAGINMTLRRAAQSNREGGGGSGGGYSPARTPSRLPGAGRRLHRPSSGGLDA